MCCVFFLLLARYLQFLSISLAAIISNLASILPVFQFSIHFPAGKSRVICRWEIPRLAAVSSTFLIFLGQSLVLFPLLVWRHFLRSLIDSFFPLRLGFFVLWRSFPLDYTSKTVLIEKNVRLLKNIITFCIRNLMMPLFRTYCCLFLKRELRLGISLLLFVWSIITHYIIQH